jgi:hypothetical protein
MTYVCDIGNGQRLLVENDGDDTQVASCGDSGQQQNQSTANETYGAHETNGTDGAHEADALALAFTKRRARNSVLSHPYQRKSRFFR